MYYIKQEIESSETLSSMRISENHTSKEINLSNGNKNSELQGTADITNVK